MPNQLYIDPATPVHGVHAPPEDAPATDGLFLGHRFIDGELEVLLGVKDAADYRIAAVLCHQDARLLANRLALLLNAIEQGTAPNYARPTQLPFPPPKKQGKRG